MRKLTEQDLQVTSGKGQIFFGSGSPGNNLQYTMNNDIALIVQNVWVCCYNCEAGGASYTDDFADAVLSYIVQTNFAENFDLDGHFCLAIPDEIAAWATQPGLKLSGPLWTPTSNAPRQKSKTIPAGEE